MCVQLGARHDACEMRRDAMGVRTRGRARGCTSRDVERGEEGHR